MAFGISAGTYLLGGAMLGSSLIAANASSKAASAQGDAAANSNATQLKMYDQTRGDQAPWRQAGSTALSQLGTMTAPGGALTHTFDRNDLTNGLAPNYDFIKEQGLGAVSNMASLHGGFGGNAMKGAIDYSQGLAGHAYQQAFDNYNTGQTNIFNRLSSIAGLGQTSNGQTAQVGMNAANGISSGTLAGGAAAAAGYVGAGNAFSGGINNGLGMYQLNNLTGGRSLGGGGGGGAEGGTGGGSLSLGD